MWTRLELKERAKITFKKFYKQSVIVCIIVYLIGAAFDGTNSSAQNTIDNQNQVNQSYIGDEIYSDGDMNFDEEYIEYGSDGMNSNNGFAENTESFLSLPGDNIVSKFISGIFNIITKALSGVSAVMVIMFILAVMLVTFILRVVIYNPIKVGKNNFFMGIREGERSVGDIFVLFSKSKFTKPALTMFFMDLFTFLWTLCLIIPGIVKSYEYRMIPYILSENPEIDRSRAFELSKHMMDGQKWEVFVLDLSFIGWNLLSSLTLGILGVFYVNPYIESTNAELYAVLRENAIVSSFTNSEELPGFELRL